MTPDINLHDYESVGYVNSQSWEAWADSVKVWWDNTEFIFLASIAVSLVMVIITLIKYPKAESFANKHQDKGNNYHELSNGSDKLLARNENGVEPIEEIKKDLIETPKCPLPRLKVTCPYDKNANAKSDTPSRCPLNIDGLFDEEDVPAGTKPVPKSKYIANEIERRMSSDEKVEEYRATDDQLSQIFKMMQEEQEKFGNPSIDDLRDQMKIYCG